MVLSTFLTMESAGVLNISEADPDDRAREADHRICNNLAVIAGFIRLQAAGAAKQAAVFSGQEVYLLLGGMAARIDAVGQLHKMLSLGATAVAIDLGAYLQKMCETMRPFISISGPVELSCESDPGCAVTADEIVPIALIVSEMVTNAVKYAHPAGVAGRIDVGCYHDRNGIVVEVADNGVGLPEDFDPSEGGGLGLKLVRTFAEKLRATPIFDSDTLGLRFLLLLPKGDRVGK